MAILGEIKNYEESVTEWSIEEFFSLPVEVDSSYDSPSFHFANESWCLRIFPNGEKGKESEGYIGLYLRRKSSGSPITVNCTLGMKTADGKLDPEKHDTDSFKGIDCYGFPKWISRAELLKRKSVLLPSDSLTCVCKIKRSEFKKYSSLSDPVTKKCSYCDKTFGDQEDIQFHFRECNDLPIKCQKCSEGASKKNWYHRKCKMTDAEVDGALGQDFKKILLDGQSHDLTLKVGDKELRAHQDVLKARCRVFESMLNHDTTEKKSGVIDIPDCDSQAMEQFLLYVYCGKVETLDPTNMLRLYYIADKYDMPNLKEDCCDFIKKSLSHTNICEVIQLALTHSDTNLLEYATEYFMDNTVDIMVTVEWQNFLKDNATVGNELLFKSFRKIKEGKN